MGETISLVMRSYNDVDIIDKTLCSIKEQEWDGDIQIVHIDSGSTDGTVDIIKKHKPWKLIEIPSSEYVPGIVLNRGMREATGDWVVCVNSDAVPGNRKWLKELVACAKSEPKVGTAFSRQVPREDCQAVYAHDYDRCFGPKRESVHWDHFFSMVSCIVSREAWEEQPIREDLQYAEDEEWSKRLAANDWKVLFAEKSISEHSHNYTFKEAYKRCFGDTFAIAASSKTPARNYNWHYTVGLGTFRDAMKDLSFCWQNGMLLEWPHAIAVRFSQRMGKMYGYRAGWKHYGRSLT